VRVPKDVENGDVDGREALAPLMLLCRTGMGTEGCAILPR
jgi:hypothetical protein